MQRRVPDLGKLRELTGYEPQVMLDEVIDRVIGLLHVRRHAPVKPAEYRRMYEAEERQWWYAGQRAIALALLEPGAGRPRARAPARRGLRHRLQPARARPASGARPASTSRRTRSRSAASAACRHVRGSVLQLPFADDTFDAVTSFDVLYHAWVSDDGAAVARDGARAAARRRAARARAGAAGAVGSARRRGAVAPPLHAGRAGGAPRALRASRAAGDLLQLDPASRCCSPGARSTALLGREGSDVGFLPAPLEWAFSRALRAEAALVRARAVVPGRRERRRASPQAVSAGARGVDAEPRHASAPAR